MSIQNIINDCSELVISKNRMVGTVVTRSGRIKTTTVPTAQPFQFAVTYAPGYRFENRRGMTSQLDFLSTGFSEDIDIGRTELGLSWITGYQGDYSQSELDAIDITTVTDSNQITLTTSHNPGGYLFRAGDYIQPNVSGYRYPYEVVADVPSVLGAVTITLNRPVIESDTITLNSPIHVGTAVTWRVKMVTKPDITISSDRFLQYGSAFSLIEVIA